MKIQSGVLQELFFFGRLRDLWPQKVAKIINEKFFVFNIFWTQLFFHFKHDLKRQFFIVCFLFSWFTFCLLFLGVIMKEFSWLWKISSIIDFRLKLQSMGGFFPCLLLPLNDRYWCYLEYDKKKTYSTTPHMWSTYFRVQIPVGSPELKHTLFCINFIYRAHVLASVSKHF